MLGFVFFHKDSLFLFSLRWISTFSKYSYAYLIIRYLSFLLWIWCSSQIEYFAVAHKKLMILLINNSTYSILFQCHL
jgi:hypothetical protein